MAKRSYDERFDELLKEIHDDIDAEMANRKWSPRLPEISEHSNGRLQYNVARNCKGLFIRFASGARIRSLIAVAACLIVISAIAFLLHPNVQGAGWHSTAGKNREELRKEFSEFTALQHAPEVFPSGMKAILGPDEIPTPTYDDNFEIRRESKLYDMTWWQPIDPAKRESEPLSPVVFTRVLELRRIPGRIGNRKISLKYWTSGFSVEPVRIKPDDEVIRARKLERLSTNGPAMKTFLMTTDVSDKPEGEWFQLTVSAVFWNGFNTPEKETAASAVASGTVQNADLGVILPPLKSTIKGWALYDIPPREKRAPYNQLKAGRPPREDAGMLYWPIAHVDANHKYVIEWEWADALASTQPNISLGKDPAIDLSPTTGDMIPLHSRIGQKFLSEAEPNKFVDLAIHFVTQDNTTFCGVASSVMVLNAAGVERPISPIHGTFRLWTQENFWSEAARKVANEQLVRRDGMTLNTLGSLLHALGMQVDIRHSGDLSLEEFRKAIADALGDGRSYVLVNYYRPAIGQDGAGHISPVAAYHAGSDKFLILDVARYRYEPMWVSADVLYHATSVTDGSSRQTRGIVISWNSKGDAKGNPP